MHKHTNIFQVRHQSNTVKRVLLVRSPRCAYAFGKVLAHAEGKKRCLLEGFQKTAPKPSTPSFCPDLPQVAPYGIPLCRAELGRQPQPRQPPSTKQPQKAVVHKTQNLPSYSGQQQRSQITDGFHSLITSHVPNGQSH